MYRIFIASLGPAENSLVSDSISDGSSTSNAKCASMIKKLSVIKYA